MKENKTIEELNEVKELAELLIEQSTHMLRLFPVAKDYIEGKIDGFNLLKDYVESRIKDNEKIRELINSIKQRNGEKTNE